MGVGVNVSLAQRQARLGAFEGLTLALFITAEHQGPNGRIEIGPPVGGGKEIRRRAQPEAILGCFIDPPTAKWIADMI
jgi:hypothetical protein